MERFKAYNRIPVLKRFPEIIKDVAEKVRISHRYELNKDEKREVKEAVYKMFKIGKLYDLYKDFYDWLGAPELFKTSSKKYWNGLTPFRSFILR
jgi:ATP-dependent DNA helicase UvrD/PcrA